MNTHFSLPATFNFAAPGELLPVEFSGFGRRGYRLTKNKLIELLQQKRYAVKVVQTNHIDLCAELADQCMTFPINPFSRLAQIGLSLRQRLFVLAQRLTYPIRAAGLGVFYPLSAEPMIRNTIEEVSRNPKGLAIILHILLPHEPYMLKSDCSSLPPEKWADFDHRSRSPHYRDYLAQMMCASKMLARLFDALRARNAWQDATVIVMGDHGSRLTPTKSLAASRKKISGIVALSETDKIDLFSALLAIKQPGRGTGTVSAPIEIQRAIENFMAHRALDFGSTDSNLGWVGPRLRTPFGIDYQPVELPDSFQIRRQ